MRGVYDATVEVGLTRLKDKGAVEEWIESGLPFHILRDHRGHVGGEILAGMWGGVGNFPIRFPR
jgi:hypothetical protein